MPVVRNPDFPTLEDHEVPVGMTPRERATRYHPNIPATVRQRCESLQGALAEAQKQQRKADQMVQVLLEALMREREDGNISQRYMDQLMTDAFNQAVSATNPAQVAD